MLLFYDEDFLLRIDETHFEFFVGQNFYVTNMNQNVFHAATFVVGTQYKVPSESLH